MTVGGGKSSSVDSTVSPTSSTTGPPSGVHHNNVDGETTAATTTTTAGGLSSPAPPSTSADSSAATSAGGSSDAATAKLIAAPFTVCSLCGENFHEPKVLACFHTFCKVCLEKLVEHHRIDNGGAVGMTTSGVSSVVGSNRRSITCPTCHAETQLCPNQGVDSLLNDYAALNLLDEQRRLLCEKVAEAASGGATAEFSIGGDPLHPQSGDRSPASDQGVGGVVTTDDPGDGPHQKSLSPPAIWNGGVPPSASPPLSGSPSVAQQLPCTGCKTKDSPAVAHCVDCKNALCANCVAAHKYMHCFEQHRLVDLTAATAGVEPRRPAATSTSPSSSVRPVHCPQHQQQQLLFFCFTCNLPICHHCTMHDHTPSQHHFESVADVGAAQLEYMHRLLEEARCKQNNLTQTFKSLDAASQRLNICFEKAQVSISETSHLLQQFLDEQRHQVLRDLDNAYSSKQTTLGLIDRKLQQTMEKLSNTIEFTGRLLRFSSPVEVLVFKKLLENRLQSVLNFNLDLPALVSQHENVEFVPNLQAARLAISNTFGYVRQGQQQNDPQHQFQQSLMATQKAPVKPISRPVVGSLPSNESSPPILGSSFPGSGALAGCGGGSSTTSALSPLSSSLADYHLHNGAPGLHTSRMGGVLLNGPSGLMPNSSSQFSPPPILGGMDGPFGTMNSLGLSVGSNGPSGPSHHAFSDSNLISSKQYGGSAHSIGPFSSTTATDLSSTYGAFDKWPSSCGSNAADFGALSTSSFYGNGGVKSSAVGLNADPLSGGAGGGLLSNNSFFQPGSSLPSNLFDNFTSSQTSAGCAGGLSLLNGAAAAFTDASLLKNASSALFPPKSQIKRHKMIYHCKFGEFGVMEGQFTEPSGVAVNAQNDVVVADTNNHRIQIFDKEGRFKFQFGECGKRDGQLLYPNRVAVNKATGDIVVTERSPTHQIQVYNQYGQFLRKFGANILQHPRGVTVDYKGRVVVVECKVMRVIIFDLTGQVLQKFGCSKYLEFPNGVVTNDKQEIFISDNRAHCVKVFNYDGAYLRQIGGEGLTNYPIGVGVNHLGEVVVADNHNNFNLTVFQQDGQLVNALESKVKHAQCFDVALLDDGSIVLASKDYRLYIYRYLQLPPLPM